MNQIEKRKKQLVRNYTNLFKNYKGDGFKLYEKGNEILAELRQMKARDKNISINELLKN